MSAAEKLNSSTQQKSVRLFTFWVEDALFGLPIENVLSVSQDMAGMRLIPGDNHIKGALGMIEFLNHVVPVVDFANNIELKSGTELANEMVELLKAREQDHVNWLDALEKSIREDIPFKLARNPHECAFGKWYDAFTTNDETLQEIMEGFDVPHKKIHAMADTLLSLSGRGKTEEALGMLKLEREITLARLIKRFGQAREHALGAVRPVLLYVTNDGNRPVMALRIDQIHDVMEYDLQKQLPVTRLERFINSDARRVVRAYLSETDGHNCVQIDPVVMAEFEHTA
ncbi:MAG: CZB domain-containing protein [bacterium]